MACNNQACYTEKSASDCDVQHKGDNTLPKGESVVITATGTNAPQVDAPNVDVYVDHANRTGQASGPGLSRNSLHNSSYRRLLGEFDGRRTSSPSDCQMCHNYEHQLQAAQMLQQENKKQLLSTITELTEKSAKLQDISSRYAELESMLEERVTTQEAKFVQLEDKLKGITTRYESLISNYRQHRKATETEIRQLEKAFANEQANFQLLKLHYDSLVGSRMRATAELSEQPINIPSDKTELELLTLKLYEENLALRAAREHLDNRLTGETDLSSLEDSGDHTFTRHSRTENTQTLRHQLEEANAQLSQLNQVVAQRDAEVVLRARCDDQIKEMRTTLAESLAKTAAKEAELTTIRAENERLQTRLVCLQSDLENIESVQADFVHLSQNLQMQLERLRQAETELRWVEPDQAVECFACHAAFSSSTKKVNCRHCGKVHCAKCLRKFTSPTGPGRRAQPVCDLCHTLLDKHAAPYFSKGIKSDSSPHS